MHRIPRFNALGVGVSRVNLASAVERLLTALRAGEKGYVCLADAHSLSRAQRDPAHREVLNRSLLTTPDGMPVVWMGRLQGAPEVERVYGPDLLLALACATAGTSWSHFFYGAAPGTAPALAERLRRQFPSLQVTGTFTPPFRSLNAAETAALTDTVARQRPSIMWIGLSTPKQERFMAELLPRLETTLMIGVGAAFDFLSGRIRQAPRWVQRSGFEWLHRLAQEPRRLTGRYLRSHPAFLLNATGQLCGVRRYPLPDFLNAPSAE